MQTCITIDKGSSIDQCRFIGCWAVVVHDHHVYSMKAHVEADVINLYLTYDPEKLEGIILVAKDGEVLAEYKGVKDERPSV